MLDGLDQIDWSQLSHAYGTATDVPALLRRLADGASEVRGAALSELCSNIWHQGTVYQATAHAVPFLIELAKDPAVPDRSHILSLLHAIAEGWLDCQRYAVQSAKFLSAATAQRKAVERRHYQAAHAAVSEGLAAVAGLLTDEEAEVRLWTAFVLAQLTDHARQVADNLLDAIDSERDDACRAGLQFALVALARNAGNPAITDVVVRRLTSVFDEASSEVASLGAGIGLLQLEQEPVIPGVLQVARPRLVSHDDVFESIPWPGCSTLYSLLNAALKFAPREQLKWIVEGLVHAEREVRSKALGCGVHLCEEFRWGPGELVPVYAQLVERVDADERRNVLQWMRSMGGAGVAMLATLKQHRLPDVREHAAEQLNRIETNPENHKSWLAEKRPVLLPSVAELAKTIESHQGSSKWRDESFLNAVIQLGFHGPNAHPAVEVVRALTERESPWIRVHSIRALWRITRNPDLVVPLLEAEIVPQQVVFLVLDCLKQIGSDARAVAPELHRLLDTDRRFFRQGWVDPCGLDEAFCEECAVTLQSLQTDVA
jgi:hypothetical protein